MASGVIRSMIVKIGVDLSELDKNFAKAMKSMEKASKSLKKTGDFLTNNITKPMLAVGASLVAMTFKAAQSADELMVLSSITHISTDTLQELGYAGAVLGTDLDTVKSALTKLSKSMFEADQGNKDTIQAFAALGVAIYDLDTGKMRPAYDVFMDVIDALGKMESPALADGYAMTLMGKSATELNPLIAAGTEEIKKMMEAGKALGVVISEEDVKALADLNDQIDGLKLAAGAASAKIAAELAPILKDVMDYIIGELPKLTGKIIEVIDKYKELEPEQQQFITTLGLVGLAIGPATLILSKLLTPIGLITAAIVGLMTEMGYLYATDEDMRDWVDNGIYPAILDLLNWIDGIILKWKEMRGIIEEPVTIPPSEQKGSPSEYFKEDIQNIIKGIEIVPDAPGEAYYGVSAADVQSIIDTVTGVQDKINDIGDVILENIAPPDAKRTLDEKRWEKTMGMAEGGILTAPQLVLAGEAGPEAFIPLDKLSKMVGGQNIIQIILDGRVIQEYTDNSLGKKLSAFA